MTLADFLKQTAYNNGTVVRNYTLPDTDPNFVSDADALADWQKHVEYAHADVAPESVNSVLADVGAFAALQYIAKTDGHPLQDNIGAFMSPANGNYNFKIGTTTGDRQIAELNALANSDPAITLTFGDASKGLNRTVDISAALAAARTEIIGLANRPVKPGKNATLEQVKAIRHPATWKPVTIASGNPQVVLPEGTALAHSGSFRFTVTPSESFNGNVQIRIKSKQENQTTFALWPQYPIVITINSADAVKYVFKRVKELQAERHFSFEYLELYDGALTSVSVEGIA